MLAGALLVVVTLASPGGRLVVTPQEHRAALEAYELGTRAKASGDLAQARRHFATAVGLDPTWGQPFLELAEVLRLHGQEPALRGRLLNGARQLLPGNARALHELGLWEVEQGRPAAAIAAWQRALELRPHYDEARLALAQALEAGGEWGAALEHYQLVLRRAPLLPGALHGVAECGRRLGLREVEESALLQLLSVAGNNPHELLRVARFYERTGDQARARELMDSAARQSARQERPRMRPLPPSPR